MKRSIAAFLVVFLMTFSILPQDKYSRIADKAFQEIAPNQKESGLSTEAKTAIGVAGGVLAVGAAVKVGKLLWDKFSKDKYERIAEKAFEAVKNTD